MTTTLVPDTTSEEVAERARRFVDEELIPREQAAEAAGGRLPAEEVAAIRAAGARGRAQRRAARPSSTAARAGRT